MREDVPTPKLALVLVGLPARGKSAVAAKITRFLCWQGYRARIFNVGNYRRERLGADKPHTFFDPDNREATELREQLARLGDTPFELAGVTVELPDAVMVPRSVLNDLRRRAASELAQVKSHPVAEPDALERLRVSIGARSVSEGPGKLTVLVRTLDQLDAVLAWAPPDGLPRPAAVFVARALVFAAYAFVFGFVVGPAIGARGLEAVGPPLHLLVFVAFAAGLLLAFLAMAILLWGAYAALRAGETAS